MYRIDLYDDDDVLIDRIECEDVESIGYVVERYCSSHKIDVGSYQAYPLRGDEWQILAQ